MGDYSKYQFGSTWSSFPWDRISSPSHYDDTWRLCVIQQHVEFASLCWFPYQLRPISLTIIGHQQRGATTRSPYTGDAFFLSVFSLPWKCRRKEVLSAGVQTLFCCQNSYYIHIRSGNPRRSSESRVAITPSVSLVDSISVDLFAGLRKLLQWLHGNRWAVAVTHSLPFKYVHGSRAKKMFARQAAGQNLRWTCNSPVKWVFFCCYIKRSEISKWMSTGSGAAFRRFRSL